MYLEQIQLSASQHCGVFYTNVEEYVGPSTRGLPHRRYLWMNSWETGLDRLATRTYHELDLLGWKNLQEQTKEPEVCIAARTSSHLTSRKILVGHADTSAAACAQMMLSSVPFCE
jgi:hypothetical protein